MSLRTPTVLSRTGILDLVAGASAVDAGLTDWWVNTGREMAYVNNASAGSLTITLQYNGPAATVDGQVLTNKTVVVAAGKMALIGPFPTILYNAPATGFTTLGWSVSASITVAIVNFLNSQ